MSKEVKARYVAVAISAEHYPAEGEKSPRIGVELRVVEGDDAGKQLFWYGSLKEGKAQEITIEALRAMGWQCNDITALTGLGSVKCAVTETHEMWEGKLQKRFSVWPLRKKQTIRDEDRAAFAAQFKALAAKRPAVVINDENRAPAELPEVRTTGNGAAQTTAPEGLPF